MPPAISPQVSGGLGPIAGIPALVISCPIDLPGHRGRPRKRQMRLRSAYGSEATGETAAAADGAHSIVRDIVADLVRAACRDGAGRDGIASGISKDEAIREPRASWTQAASGANHIGQSRCEPDRASSHDARTSTLETPVQTIPADTSHSRRNDG